MKTPRITLTPIPPVPLGNSLYETGYAESPEFTAAWWIHIVRGASSTRCWFSVVRAGKEVARLEIDEKRTVNPDFEGAPEVAEGFLEIAFFEVAASERLAGIGTAVIRTVEHEFSDRHLAAYSEGADGFWASLGWTRYVHATDSHLYRPLYIRDPWATGAQGARS